jgi:hypothetical protein
MPSPTPSPMPSHARAACPLSTLSHSKGTLARRSTSRIRLAGLFSR